MFVCTCVGVALLHFSHQEQLTRIYEGANSRRLVDTSGTEILKQEKSRSLVPISLVFVVALLATPIAAIAFSLAFKGNPPKNPAPPGPPTFAYTTTPEPRKHLTQAPKIAPQGPIAIAPNGIANAAPNFGTQSVVNEPPQRSLSQSQKDIIRQLLTPSCPFEVAVRHVAGNFESQSYADQLAGAVKSAGCTLRRPRFLIEEHSGIGVWVALHDTTAVPPAANALLRALTSAGIDAKGSSVDAFEPGVIYLMVELNDTRQP